MQARDVAATEVETASLDTITRGNRRFWLSSTTPLTFHLLEGLPSARRWT